MTGDDSANDEGGDESADATGDELEVDAVDEEEIEAPDAADSTAEAEENVLDKMNEINVERKLGDLRAMYGELPVTEETFELSPADYTEVFTATNNTGYDGNSVVFIVRDGEDLPELSENIPAHAGGDTRDRVLMVLGRGADVWALPGGGEKVQYESMQGTTLRRANEQTNIRCTIDSVEEVFHRKYYPETDAQGSVHTLDVYFRATYASGAIEVDESELIGAAWFAEPPERMTEGARQLWERFLDERDRSEELPDEAERTDEETA
ncbi:NUDIX domain-containing protein [Haloarcula amylovorans]|uniref:NUDIX domain-containing protein n=1 Tax=Haloarcula amylovorans TaxID=2562280 RepID=UPI001430C212